MLMRAFLVGDFFSFFLFSAKITDCGASMTDYKNLSEVELQDVIADAENALKEKKNSKRKAVIAQINDLAASIGVQIEIKDNDKRSQERGSKYRLNIKIRPIQTKNGRVAGLPQNGCVRI